MSVQVSFEFETIGIQGTAVQVQAHKHCEPFLPRDAIGKSTCPETASSLVRDMVLEKWQLAQPTEDKRKSGGFEF